MAPTAASFAASGDESTWAAEGVALAEDADAPAAPQDWAAAADA